MSCGNRLNTHLLQIGSIKISGGFWQQRLELVVRKVIPYQWHALNDSIPGAEPSHAVENFRIAAGQSSRKYQGMVFQDSDVAKWLEAASYSLAVCPDAALEASIDELIALIGKAQQPDGYLNTYYTVAKPEARWTEFAFGHELYSAGHMIEAAVAYYEATGKKSLLLIMEKYVAYLDEIFGQEEDKLKKYCGHEEIELALIKLYKVTENEKHLRLAQFFIDERGKQPCFLESEPSFVNAKNNQGTASKWFALDYHQAHAPVREQTEADGHAVRAMYLYTAMADLVRETGDTALCAALEKLWDNVTQYRMYVTGGIGSQAHGERFTFDYDLPNATAYTETCASIGLVFWAYRMLLLSPDRKYADVMEKALYNGILSGISLDGKKYFYVNPLEVQPEAVEKRYDLQHVKPERQQWYGCACCPPNIARLITSVGKYIYTQEGDIVYVHLFMESRAEFRIADEPVSITQQTNYPWEGRVTFRIHSALEAEFGLAVRIPGWCKTYSYTINGEIFSSPEPDKGYMLIKGMWKDNDEIEFDFDMDIQLIQAHPRVRASAGKVAIQRGPIVYCLEEIDNGSNLSDVFIGGDAKLTARFDPQLLGGVVVITGEAERSDEACWSNVLYKPVGKATKKVMITAVPYYAWGNRKPGEMLVWLGCR